MGEKAQPIDKRDAAEIIARLMFACMVPNKLFDRLDAHVMQSYLNDGIDCVSRLEAHFNIERRGNVATHPETARHANEVRESSYYPLLALREKFALEVIDTARCVVYGGTNFSRHEHALTVAVYRLDGVDAALATMTPPLSLKGAPSNVK